MTYAILRVAAATYADIKGRLVALDEKIRLGPVYQTEYVRPAGIGGRPEHLVFGPVGLEAEAPIPPAALKGYTHEAHLAELERDAARFRALMRCGRISMQGSAGVDPKTLERRPNSNVHFGAEFWPEPLGQDYREKYPESAANYDRSTAWGRACILALADEILAQEAGGGVPAS